MPHHLMTDDPAVVRIASRAVADARAAGLDHSAQTQQAVSAVLAACPDMTAGDAMTLVERVRD